MSLHPPAAPGAPRNRELEALALLFTAGATVALLVVVLPHGVGVDRGWDALAAVAAYPAALLLWTLGHRAPWWVADVALAAGTVVVTAGIAAGHGGPAAVASTLFYIWVPLYTGFFLSPRRMAVQMVWMLAAYGALLAGQGVRGGGEPALWVLLAGASVTAATVTRSLRTQVERTARHDPLTGLPNRWLLQHCLDREVARATRTGSPLVVALLDVDHLKQVNDEQGHQAGDRLLRAATTAWSAATRAHDVLARYGGDEFALVLPHADEATAETVLQRLHEATPIGFTHGLSAWHQGQTAEDVLGAADDRLYLAKAARPRRYIDLAEPAPQPHRNRR